MVFHSVLSKIDEALSIIPSAYVFVSGDFNVYHKDERTNFGRTDRPGEICLSQMILLRWWTLLLGSLTVIVTVLLFWINFFLPTLVFVLQWLFLHWEILIMFLSLFPWTSCKLKTECLVSSCSLWLFSCWLGWSSWDVRDVTWEDIFVSGKGWNWCVFYSL